MQEQQLLLLLLLPLLLLGQKEHWDRKGQLRAWCLDIQQG
jgi:hypothetical protein